MTELIRRALINLLGSQLRTSNVKLPMVEDDSLVRVVAVEALLDAGFEVVETESGPEALEQCKKALGVRR